MTGILRHLSLRGAAAPYWRKRIYEVLQFAAQADERLAALLVLSAGIFDAYGLLHYGTYLSFMRGIWPLPRRSC